MSKSSTPLPVPGISARFAMVPTVSIVDPGLTDRDRRVLAVLLLHAYKDGHVSKDATQKRIAAILGWYYVDGRSGERLLKHSNVTEAYANLVRLGYLTNSGHSGWNCSLILRLHSPKFEDGYIIRPDGSRSKSTFDASTAPSPTEAPDVKAARKKAEGLARFAAKEAKAGREPIPQGIRATPVVEHPGDVVPTKLKKPLEKYTQDDIDTDLMFYHEGMARELPDVVYQKFEVPVPTFRTVSIAHFYADQLKRKNILRDTVAPVVEVEADDLELGDMDWSDDHL